MDEFLKIVAGLLSAAYSLGVIKFGIVDFFQRQGVLHERHVQKANEIEIAEARVETEKVIPALVSLIRKVGAAQRAAADQGERLGTTDALEQATSVPQLQDIADALAARERIGALFTSLELAACRVWQSALAHVTTLLVAAAAFIGYHYSKFGWLSITFTAVLTLSIASGFACILFLKIYHDRERRFLALIRGAR